MNSAETHTSAESFWAGLRSDRRNQVIGITARNGSPMLKTYCTRTPVHGGRKEPGEQTTPAALQAEHPVPHHEIERTAQVLKT